MSLISAIDKCRANTVIICASCSAAAVMEKALRH